MSTTKPRWDGSSRLDTKANDATASVALASVRVAVASAIAAAAAAWPLGHGCLSDLVRLVVVAVGQVGGAKGALSGEDKLHAAVVELA